MKGGYYTDSGNQVDPDSIELPELCKSCKKNGVEDEEIPCNLNRIDQQKDMQKGKRFICEAFENIE